LGKAGFNKSMLVKLSKKIKEKATQRNLWANSGLGVTDKDCLCFSSQSSASN